MGQPGLPDDLGGPWVQFRSSSMLSVSDLFLKFFESWSLFLRNDLKRKLSFSWQQDHCV